MTKVCNKSDKGLINNKNLIPSTRINSWKAFRSNGQKHTIKNFILVVLEDSSSPLSCRQISEISGIEIQSLTNPLQTLVLEERLSTSGRTVGATKRDVIAYSIIKNDRV
jgi:hypothetical protein